MPGEPNAEIPQGGVSGESTSQPPAQPSETSFVAKPEGPTTVDSSLGLASQEASPTLHDTKWQRILDLGNKSYLDLSPEEMTELQSLTAKGKELLGNDFNNQLTLKKTEALRIKNEQEAARLNEFDRQMNEAGRIFKEGARAIAQEFEDKTNARAEEVKRREAALRQESERAKTKTPEQILQEVLNDPKMASAKAELSWLDLSVGKPVENVDPELIKKMEALRQNAVEQIMRDPQGYEQKLKNLKSEFFQSRGIELPLKLNPNTT